MRRSVRPSHPELMADPEKIVYGLRRTPACGVCGRGVGYEGCLNFSLPPRRLRCPGCQAFLDTTFLYRSNWLWYVLAKALSLVGLLVGVAGTLALQLPKGEDPVGLTLIVAAGAGLLVALVGIVASFVLYVPLQALVDLGGWLWRWARARG